MVQALRHRITIGAHGRIEIDRTDLPEGATAEVIVLVDDATGGADTSRLVDYIGKAKGSFASAEEAEAFLRAERDAWDR